MSGDRTYRFRHIDGAGGRSHTGPVLARVRSATLRGVEAATVFVEVDVTSGLPSFSTVGATPPPGETRGSPVFDPGAP
jgi:hypothetical protein